MASVEEAETELNFRRVLLEIDAQITKPDLHRLVYLCETIISSRRASQIETAIELFRELQRHERLGPSNIEFLKTQLTAIRRIDLAGLLERGTRYSAVTVEADQCKEVTDLEKKIQAKNSEKKLDNQQSLALPDSKNELHSSHEEKVTECRDLEQSSGTEAEVSKTNTQKTYLTDGPKKLRTLPISEGKHLPRRILLLCNKWQAWGESIPVINQQMCQGLANGGHQIICLVPDASSAETEEASKRNVRLIKCSEAPGIEKTNIRLLYHHLTLPFHPDLVVGHGKLTGPIAAHFAEKFACPRLHVIHELPAECERFDDAPAPTSADQGCDEVDLARSADFVAAIGVLLKDRWSSLLNKEVLEVTPGLPDLVTRNSIPSPQCRCFVAAKLGSPLDSGLDIGMWALNNSNKDEHRPYKATLIARNIDPDTPFDKGIQMLDALDKDGIDLNVKTAVESREAFINIQGSTVFLYPARVDPFGVAVLDAIATGIPVLISEQSGLAHLIKKHFDERFHGCILNASDMEDVSEWSAAINRIFGDREEAFQFAASFRSDWTSRFTWNQAMVVLIEKLVTSGNLPASPTTLNNSILPIDVSKADLELVKEIGLFDKRQKFVLFLSPENAAEIPSIVHIAQIYWVTVFDFDQESDNTGYLSACDWFLKNAGKPACRILPRDGDRVNLPNGIPWIMVEGNPLMPVDVRRNMNWISKVFEEINKKHIQAITLVVLWNSKDSTKILCKQLQSILCIASASAAFKDANVFVLSTSGAVDSRLDDIAEEWNTEIKHVTIEGLCGAIFKTAITNPLHIQDPDFSLPTVDGMKVLPPWLRWVDSELTVLYNSIGTTPEYGNDDASHFYRGGKISWYATEMNYAVERESWEPLKKAIENKVKYAGASRLLFSHQRGTGGSTSARRILYDFHRRYPCVCLKSINNRTQDAITQLWKFCEVPVIILADIKQAPGEEYDMEVFFDNLSNERVSCLIVHVVHRFSSVRGLSEYKEKKQERSKHIVAKTLTGKEADEFVKVYSSQNRDKTTKLKRHRVADTKLQIPFYYALVAFEDRFEGLKPFVTECLEGLSKMQESVLVFLAMANYYAQATIPAWQFARSLGVSQRAFCSLEEYLPLSTLDLLIEEDGLWQCRHNLISREILRQLLSKPFNLHEDNWVTMLSQKAIEFIRCMDEKVCSEILINRDDDDAKSFFSALIMEIPDNDDAIKVFKEAITVFPHNPYFKVHLGRYYSKQKWGDGFQNAIKYTNDGILTAADYSAHCRSRFTQMKGMVYKRYVQTLIHDSCADLDTIIPFVEKGTEAFRHAVSISSELCEENYIPLVAMMCILFRYVEKIYAEHGGFLGYLSSSESGSQFFRESLLDVSDALESVPESDQYPYLRRQIHSFQKGRHRKTAELLKFLKDFKESGKASTASVNREIVRVWLDLCQEKKIPIPEVAPEMIELLGESLRHRLQVGLTMRLWVKIAPHVPVSLPVAEEKVTVWCSLERSVWSFLYKYIFACIRILQGGRDRYEEVRKNAQDDLRSTVHSMRRYDVGRIRQPDRPVLFLGEGKGMAQLVTLDTISLDVRKERSVPVKDLDSLYRLKGVISKIGDARDKVGEITMSCGLNISFRPDLCEPPLVGDLNMYKNVHFYLAFNCFGAEAYNVRIVAEH